MLKYENIQAKLGRACDLETLETLSLPNKQLTEVHDLSKLKALKEIDLRFDIMLHYNDSA